MPRLAPAVSAIARSTMKIAYEDLEQTLTPADARSLQSTSTLEQVRAAAVDIEKQLAARQALRNMRRLTPLLNGLEHYAKTVDVLCNGTPFLSCIWSPITLILRVASEYIEAFEHIMKGYSRIAEALKRFEILRDAFSNDHDFQQTLAVFYADILQFHKHAYKFVRRNGWKLLFLTSWGRFQRRFDNIFDDLRRHGELVDLEANARDIAEARKLRQDIRSWRQESVDQVSRDEDELTAKQFRHITSWIKIDEAEQVTIFDAIREEASKFSGTSSWITSHSKFRAWLQQRPDTPFLWLQGNPGTGKSILSAELVNFLRAANCIVVKHFCTFSYPTTGKYEQILRSILLQLLRGNASVLAHVYQQYVLEKKSPSISTLEQLICTATVSLSDEPCKAQHLWIILDGLDECETSRQARLLSLLNQVAFKPSVGAGSICKVLISSRSNPALAKTLRRKPTVSLSDELPHLDASIRIYVSQRLQACGERLHQLELEPSNVEDMENAVVERSKGTFRGWPCLLLRRPGIKPSTYFLWLRLAYRLSALQQPIEPAFHYTKCGQEIQYYSVCNIVNITPGMFLYARLVLDYLVSNIFYSGAEMRRSIEQLPQSLADFYQRIVTQILSGKDTRSQDRIKSILCWVAYAKRPLKKIELLSALSFGSRTHEVDHLVPRYILDTCSPLVEERADTSLAFIHVSVKEFLESFPTTTPMINEQNAIREQGMASITCLLSGLQIFRDTFESSARSTRLIKGIHGLHVYATEYWTEYILEDATVTHEVDLGSPLVHFATNFAQSIYSHMTLCRLNSIAKGGLPDDARLSHFRNNHILYQVLQDNIYSRSRKRFETEVLDRQSELLRLRGTAQLTKLGPGPTAGSTSLDTSLDPISCMLQSYQQAVEHLLDAHFHPGVSAEELKLFKSNFRTSAYTCRIQHCPRATTGFISKESRDEHEMTHVGGFRCTEIGCQYPPFSSAQTRKNHINSKHPSTVPPKSIRKVPASLPREIRSDWRDQPAHGSLGERPPRYLGSFRDSENSSRDHKEHDTFDEQYMTPEQLSSYLKQQVINTPLTNTGTNPFIDASPQNMTPRVKSTHEGDRNGRTATEKQSLPKAFGISPALKCPSPECVEVNTEFAHSEELALHLIVQHFRGVENLYKCRAVTCMNYDAGDLATFVRHLRSEHTFAEQWHLLFSSQILQGASFTTLGPSGYGPIPNTTSESTAPMSRSMTHQTSFNTDLIDGNNSELDSRVPVTGTDSAIISVPSQDLIRTFANGKIPPTGQNDFERESSRNNDRGKLWFSCICCRCRSATWHAHDQENDCRVCGHRICEDCAVSCDNCQCRKQLCDDRPACVNCLQIGLKCQRPLSTTLIGTSEPNDTSKLPSSALKQQEPRDLYGNDETQPFFNKYRELVTAHPITEGWRSHLTFSHRALGAKLFYEVLRPEYTEQTLDSILNHCSYLEIDIFVNSNSLAEYRYSLQAKRLEFLSLHPDMRYPKTMENETPAKSGQSAVPYRSAESPAQRLSGFPVYDAEARILSFSTGFAMPDDQVMITGTTTQSSSEEIKRLPQQSSHDTKMIEGSPITRDPTTNLLPSSSSSTEKKDCTGSSRGDELYSRLVERYRILLSRPMKALMSSWQQSVAAEQRAVCANTVHNGFNSLRSNVMSPEDMKLCIAYELAAFTKSSSLNEYFTKIQDNMATYNFYMLGLMSRG